ncbi:MAG: hypothetical protein ACI89U_001688 [Gammaproteobacteria bacterium]|jgi:hypothetical protein
MPIDHPPNRQYGQNSKVSQTIIDNAYRSLIYRKKRKAREKILINKCIDGMIELE